MNFDEIIQNAYKENASDVHFAPKRPVFVRLHGEMKPVTQDLIVATDLQNWLLKVLSDKDKNTLGKDRQVDFMLRVNGIRLRANAFFQENGVSISLRIIPHSIRDFSTIGFPEFVSDKVMNLRQGLVLVVGPTGMGKSTTLASIIQERARQKTEHFVTIEDPIEYLLPPGKSIIQQREVGRDVIDFQSGIRGALREDPDVLLVGEMRDLETVSAALTMAETGHLVFGTLHTNNGPETIHRIIDAFPAEKQDQIRSQLSATLTMVISQRLLPAGGPNMERCLAFEILTSNYAIKNYIRQNKIFQIPNVLQTDSSGEMIQYEQSLAGLVLSGRTTKEIAMSFAQDTEQLESILQANEA